MRIRLVSTVGVLAASVALLACERSDRSSTMTLAQYGGTDAGSGMPSPMPGSPIGDSGISPITPTPSPSVPTPGTPPGSPSNPGSPSPSPGPTGR